MGIISKWFIQSRTEQPDGSGIFTLGVVCRGEENKQWAAATPSGSAKIIGDDTLEHVWATRKELGAEVEMTVFTDSTDPDPGKWTFDSCSWTYGGCAIKLRQPGGPWGTIEMSINATAATNQMRKHYADSLLEGKPARFSVAFSRARVEQAAAVA